MNAVIKPCHVRSPCRGSGAAPGQAHADLRRFLSEWGITGDALESPTVALGCGDLNSQSEHDATAHKGSADVQVYAARPRVSGQADTDQEHVQQLMARGHQYLQGTAGHEHGSGLRPGVKTVTKSCLVRSPCRGSGAVSGQARADLRHFMSEWGVFGDDLESPTAALRMGCEDLNSQSEQAQAMQQYMQVMS